jgi:hypothetical protein
MNKLYSLFVGMILTIVVNAQLSQVTLSTNSSLCNSTMIISADFVPCGFDGEMEVEFYNAPAGVTPSIQSMTVTGGMGSFSLSVDPGIIGSFTIFFTVTQITNQNGCGTFLFDVVQYNGFTVTCPPPSNNECANAITLNMEQGSCTPSGSYSNENATASGISSSCITVNDEDVFFETTATMNEFTLEFANLPFAIGRVAVYESCSGSEVYCAILAPGNPIHNVTGLTPGSNYIIRVATSPSAPDGTFDLCVWEPCTQQAWYQDSDMDTYGNPNVSLMDCNQPAGYVSNPDDCDDNDPNIGAIGTSCDDGYSCTSNTVVLADCTCGGGTINTTTNTFTDTGNGFWIDSANWSLGVVPDICHDVVIPAGNSVTIVNSEVAECYTLTVDDNAEFTVEDGAILEVVAPNN